MKNYLLMFIIFVIVVVVCAAITYVIWNSDIPMWLKFYLLLL